MPTTLDPGAGGIDRAAAALRDGGLVAFPTETVYGLGADTMNAAAIAAIYATKGRPADNPLIAHVTGAAMARPLVTGWDDRCDALTDAFWPGPLTLVLPRAADVPEASSAGRDTIAVRAPRHDMALALLEAFGGAISAPSANRSGHVSPTSAAHVASDFADVNDLLILDGGPCDVGVESTVLDLTADPPRVLRPGSVTGAMLRVLIGAVDTPAITTQAASPGTAQTHYAPRTPARLVPGADLAAALRDAPPSVVLCFEPGAIPPPHTAIGMSREPAFYARDLYAALRRADAREAAMILIETPPDDTPLWRTIHDRLARATAG